MLYNNAKVILIGRWNEFAFFVFMVVASVYPASRIVVKPINCEYTSMLDNMLLLEP